ncbi:MAG: hypothetical protein AAGJ73_08215 [Pseudomonadota bacterium]
MEIKMEVAVEKPNRFGVIAMAIAALALFLTVTHWVAGPFNPSPPIEDQIVETAVKIKEAAQRAVTGDPAPAPEEPAFDIDRALQITSISLAGLSMAAALFALFLRERQGPALIGFSLGGAVLMMTWLQWLALLIVGVILIAAIVNNIGDILSF